MTTLLVCLFVLVANADFGYQPLEYRTTSSYLSSRYSTTGTHDVRITPVGAINLNGDLPGGASRPRRAYGPTDDDGFFSDPEDFFSDGDGFGDDPDGFDDGYDVYTKEPGELPVGSLPCLFMLLLALLYTRLPSRLFARLSSRQKCI